MWSIHPMVGRVRARRALGRTVSVWYHRAYAPPILASTSRVANVEPRRGELIIGDLARDRFLRPGDVSASPRASTEALLRFHTPRYVEGTTHPATLGRVFGLEEGVVDVDELLESQRRAVGGTLAAAEQVLSGSVRVAFNLGGGFHHAGPDFGSGFCVYNDVGVAITALRSAGVGARIAVVDLDYHQGDGTLAAFEDDPSVFLLSLHGSVWSHRETHPERDVLLTGEVGDSRYLAVLARALRDVERFGPSLVFYIAGNDVLAGDRLGGFSLTLRGVLDRDLMVLAFARRVHARLVVTLGGGYSSDAWRASANFLRALLTRRAVLRASASRELRAEFERIARSIDPLDLQRDEDDFSLTEQDLFAGATRPVRPRRILDFYSADGVELAFERYGILAKIRDRGYRDLRVAIEAGGDRQGILRIHGRFRSEAEATLLMELVARRGTLRPRGCATSFRVLRVEWLLLQDPHQAFTLSRPRLPGQTFPGLGIAREIREILVRAALRLELDGLVDRPSYLHMALGIADGGRDRSPGSTPGVCFFADPTVEGRFRALWGALQERGAFEASWLMEGRRVQDTAGHTLEWMAEDHVLPLAPELGSHFGSEAYLHAVALAEAETFRAGIVVTEPSQGKEHEKGPSNVEEQRDDRLLIQVQPGDASVREPPK